MQPQKTTDDFIYAVSHDLKEPLRGISVLSSVLLEDYHGKLDDEGEQYLRRMADCATRANDMIGILHSISRLHRRAPKPEFLDPVEVVEEVAKEMAANLLAKNAHIEISAPMKKIACDRESLKGILSQLIANAITYNNENEKTVEVGLLYQKTPDNMKEENTFYVRDRGIGIPARLQESAFRIFRRLPEAQRYDAKGLGAGLALAREMALHSDGNIWVESKEGEGSTFYFTLR